jgi:thiol-disulfide isomerase/thioredoxin
MSTEVHSAVRLLRIFCFSLVMLLTLALLQQDSLAKLKIGQLPKNSIANYRIRTLTGQEYSLAGWRGQVVILDFVAAWCGNSKRHVPSLTRFSAADRARGLQILGFVFDDSKTTPALVRDFQRQQKIEYPLAMINHSTFEKFVESKDLGIPQTLIYGRDGRLLAHFLGHSQEIDQAIKTLVEQELNKQANR